MVDALRAGVTTYGTFDRDAPYGDGSTPLKPAPKPFEDPSQVPYGGSPPMLMYVMAHCTQRTSFVVLFCPGLPLTKALPFAC